MRASGYDRIESDWYIEPRWAIDSLMDVEKFSGTCWDPSCGSGNIPMAMRDRGIACVGSDICDRGFGARKIDFLQANMNYDNIISNPPYNIIELYVTRALLLTTEKVAILARLALLEGQKRQELFLTTPLARVWVSSRRMSMPPGGTDIEAKGGSIAYAWFVWEHGHKGPATLGWI